MYDDIAKRVAEDKFELDLAKLSEDENFNSKNRYRLENTYLNYRDKSRTAVDEDKVVDILRKQGSLRGQLVHDLPTYNQY